MKLRPESPNRRFEFQKRSQLFIRPHNEPVSVAAVRDNNFTPGRSGARFGSCPSWQRLKRI